MTEPRDEYPLGPLASGSPSREHSPIPRLSGPKSAGGRWHWALLGQFVGLMVLGTLLLILRSPDALNNPIMYTEDGRWTGLGTRVGWLEAMWSAKDGYLVLGNVLLLLAATILSSLACGNEVLCAPESIAWLSYAFFSSIAAAAFVVTKGRIILAARWLLFVGLLFLPYGTSSNEILGRGSNIGYSLAILSALLLYARQRSGVAPGERTLLDLVIILCAATNPIVIPVAALTLALGWGADTQSRRIPGASAGQRLQSRLINLVSANRFLLIGLSAVTILVLARQVTATGAARKGQMEWANFVEVAGARSLLYPFVWPFYESLTNLWVLALLALLLVCGAICVRRIKSFETLRLVGILSLTLVLNLLMILYSRPSLTQQLREYETTFPDRYFMGTNQLVFALFIVALGALASQAGRDKVIGLVGLAVMGTIVVWSAVHTFEFTTPKMVIVTGDTWRETLCRLEISPTVGTQETVVIPTYFEGWKIELPVGVVRDAVGSPGCDGSTP